ncbi:Retrovirus-related Pol polyprotein from transposon 17.6 [Mytilus coruscus]|uniref:Retrovirus-related Pol polyprotein from transposon 17.6 n=1 Tax=Mytilus coruscus TaxID=42192 RepID=A0A6J8ENF9_MYTCO|nr:Retrovirus-related Pol polyprotein from transposon 17.6 [Mytilus coruscus]
MCRSKQNKFSAQPTKFISATGLSNTNATNLIKIRVANHFGMAMVDSGATISAISADFYYANLQKTVPLEKAYLLATGASGASLRAVGQIHVTIEVGRLSMEQTFQVFENFTHSVILGLDFLDQQKARLNFDDKTLVLQSGITEVPLLMVKIMTIVFVLFLLINDEVIPSRSEVIIPVQTVDKSIKSKIDLHPHRIDTGDAAPVRQRFYRQSPAMKTESSKHIKEMLDNNIIEPSQSEWASPVCLVRKKGSTSSSSASKQPQYRFCIDFRQLNLLCVKRVYPIVQMDDIVDMLGEAKAKFYSTVDMFNGYHQIKLDPETKHKTAFTCHEGVFEFNRLPFGLSNSPHTFQLVMSEALRGINWKSALVYMDDVLIFSKTFEEHLHHLTILFQKLREVNLKLKPTKCTFAAKEVKFLGHVLSKDGIAVDTTKIDAVKTFPVPQNITDVRAFLGLANYYRKFVKGFSKIASPLHRLLVKGAKFIWDNDCQKSFDEIKTLLISAPILAFPDFSKDFILYLYTDASQIAIGYILGQKDRKGREQGTANGNADALSRRPYGTEIVTITTATVESSTQTEATFIELDPYASILK